MEEFEDVTEVTFDDESLSETFDELSVSQQGQDHGIGMLSASEGLKIDEEPDDTCLRAYITVENRQDVRIGTYLLVPYPDEERLFARITGLEYAQEFRSDDANEIHARRAMRSEEIDEHDYKFIATLEPVAVLYEQHEELTRRMTDRVPMPETIVERATDTEEIKTGLKIPDTGVFLGHLAVGGQKVKTAAEPPTIDYRLDDSDEGGDPLVFRHSLIAGGTGSGKTHAAKNILRQYFERRYEMPDGRSPQLALVQFDPQDEYAQLHDDNDTLTTETARQYDQESIAHGGHEDTKAFVPVVGSASYGGGHHRAEQVPFTISFSMVQSNPWLIARGGLNENQYPALIDLIKRFFSEQPDGSYRAFREFLSDDLRERLSDSGRIHEATFNAVRRRTGGFGPIFDQDAPPITDLVEQFVRPGGVSVVPTYHLNSARAKETVVLALANLLISQKLSNDADYERIAHTPLVIGMDEAHNFLTDADTPQAQKVIQSFTEAAKQGRKERLGLFLITQDPQDIADPVFKQINTTIVLNLGDEDAIKAVNIPRSLESKVPYMEKGQMVVYSPDNSEPVEIIGLSNCVTRHGRESTE
ncbi:ATP-binding protein [Halocatena halophila]|uniref:ATP-binding protein n=1 Tax=Halocatena halophila TaxID=2814576 RepID=UPI002ECFC761